MIDTHGRPPVDADERRALVATYARTIWLRAALADLAPALLVFVLLVPGFRLFVPGTSAAQRAFLILIALPYAALCMGHARTVFARWFVAVENGLAGPDPTDELRAYVAKLPFRVGRIAALYWGGLVLWMPPWMIAADAWERGWIVSIALIVVICGAEGGMLTYLVAERTLRDLTALVMRSAEHPSTRRLHVSGRFLLSFASSVIIPLIVLNLIVLIAIANDALSILPSYIVLFNTLVVATGTVFVVMTSRSITDPLDALRAATERVARGELETEVRVDDSGEIGALQLGFERMIGGLREREQIRDLFGRHVGPDVAAKALASPPNLDGEIRVVTALFVDVIGSTPLAHSVPATAVVEKLNAFFDAVVRNVSREGGTVNQFQGDGAVCIFGAPLEQTDHAERALRCVRRLAPDLAKLDGIDVAVGVSTGEAVAGNVGTLDRYGYTVIGDPVNEASRLCDAAKDTVGRVLVSSATYEAAGRPSGWCDAGTFVLKGRASPTIAFTLA